MEQGTNDNLIKRKQARFIIRYFMRTIGPVMEEALVDIFADGIDPNKAAREYKLVHSQLKLRLSRFDDIRELLTQWGRI